MLAGLVFCEMLSQYPQSGFQGSLRGSPGGSAAVCDPNPPRPFARSRVERGLILKKPTVFLSILRAVPTSRRRVLEIDILAIQIDRTHSQRVWSPHVCF